MAQTKPIKKKVNFIMLIIGALMIVAAVPILFAASKIDPEDKTFNLVTGIGNMLALIGLGIVCFNLTSLLIKKLRSSDESGTTQTRGNAFWMYAGSILFSFAVFIAYLMISAGGYGEIVGFAIACFVIACLFFFINLAKMRKKIRDANYREYQKRRPAPSSTPSSKPKPTPRPQHVEWEYPPMDEGFVQRFKANRYNKDMVIGGLHGWATLSRVEVSYNRNTGFYTVQPYIEIVFNKLTIKSDRDVKDVMDRVSASYDEELELMVSVFEKMQYSYDIKKPSVTTKT